MEWRSVIGAGLSVLGASIVVAVLSYRRWLKQVRPERWRDAGKLRALVWLGLAPFCAGGALRAVTAWETALWTILTLYFAWRSGLESRRPRQPVAE